MEARAELKYARISPSKVKIVCDLIRGKDTKTAMGILMQTPKAASELMIKLLKSACANAENNHDMDPDNLYIAEIYANQGPTMKRYRAGAQGRASMILKRSSHIGVTLREKEAAETEGGQSNGAES